MPITERIVGDARLRLAGFVIFAHDAHGRTWTLGPRGHEFFTPDQALDIIEHIERTGFVRSGEAGVYLLEGQRFTTREALDYAVRVSAWQRNVE